MCWPSTRTPLSENTVQPGLPGTDLALRLRFPRDGEHFSATLKHRETTAEAPAHSAMLTICRAPGTVLDAGNFVRDRTDQNPAPTELTCWGVTESNQNGEDSISMWHGRHTEQ